MNDNKTPSVFPLTSVSQKYIVALSGFLLHVFVLLHLIGNLLVFLGPEIYNAYSHKLISNPITPLFEILLLITFLLHLGLASWLNYKNKKARPYKYAVSAYGDKGTSLINRTLWHQGVVIFVFVVLHIVNFKYGTYYEFQLGEEKIRDLYLLVVEAFQNPLTVLWYICAISILGFHLGHGLSALIQSLGFYREGSMPWIKKMGSLYSLVLVLSFNSIPLFCYFFL